MDEIEAAYTERDMTRSPPARSGTLSVKTAAEWKGKHQVAYLLRTPLLAVQSGHTG
jgi:hypothetical protein